jgi:hypothetical protein
VDAEARIDQRHPEIGPDEQWDAGLVSSPHIRDLTTVRLAPVDYWIEPLRVETEIPCIEELASDIPSTRVDPIRGVREC